MNEYWLRLVYKGRTEIVQAFIAGRKKTATFSNEYDAAMAAMAIAKLQTPCHFMYVEIIHGSKLIARYS